MKRPAEGVEKMNQVHDGEWLQGCGWRSAAIGLPEERLLDSAQAWRARFPLALAAHSGEAGSNAGRLQATMVGLLGCMGQHPYASISLDWGDGPPRLH